MINIIVTAIIVLLALAVGFFIRRRQKNNSIEYKIPIHLGSHLPIDLVYYVKQQDMFREETKND